MTTATSDANAAFAWLDDLYGARSWDELDLDLLGHAPPRSSRALFHADGREWDSQEDKLIFASGADLTAWEPSRRSS